MGVSLASMPIKIDDAIWTLDLGFIVMKSSLAGVRAEQYEF